MKTEIQNLSDTQQEYYNRQRRTNLSLVSLSYLAELLWLLKSASLFGDTNLPSIY